MGKGQGRAWEVLPPSRQVQASRPLPLLLSSCPLFWHSNAPAGKAATLSAPHGKAEARSNPYSKQNSLWHMEGGICMPRLGQGCLGWLRLPSWVNNKLMQFGADRLPRVPPSQANATRPCLPVTTVVLPFLANKKSHHCLFGGIPSSQPKEHGGWHRLAACPPTSPSSFHFKGIRLFPL